MRPEFRILSAIAVFAFAAGAATTVAPETAVVTDGAIKVDVADIEGYLLRVPEARRGEVRSSRDRIANMADNIFVSRSLAAKAREAGLDKDIVVQRRLQQTQDSLLAELYMQHLERTAPQVNLEPRARELYLADKAKYVVPEQVYVQHILVGLNGRTREMAEERAKKVYEEVKSGKEEFLALAARLSDDPDKKRNGGDMGYNSPTSFVAPLAKRIATMNTKGEISEPVESHQGFHIVKFIDRKAPETKTFDEVKRGIIAEQKELLSKRRIEEVITQIRSSRTATVYNEVLDKLVAPADDAIAKALAAESARLAAEPPKAR